MAERGDPITAVDDTATIRIRIIGGIKAAMEAETTAEAFDELGDEISQAGRAAVRATFALKALRRGTKNLAKDAIAAAGGMSALRVSIFGVGSGGLFLAAVVLPPLAAALWGVITAAGALTVAFTGGLIAAGIGVGVMVAGVIARFKVMSDVVGSSANDLQNSAYLLKGAFADATASGADKVMEGLSRGLSRLAPLLRTLQPQFTAIGSALGGMLERVLTDLSNMGPQLQTMLGRIPDVINATGDLLSKMLDFLIQIGTVGAPLVADSFRWLAKVVDSWTGSFTDGTIERAKGTLTSFAAGVRTFTDAFSAAASPQFGPWVSELGKAASVLGGPIGTILGTVYATLLRISRAALPYVVKGAQLLAKVLPGALGGAGDMAGGLFKALKPLGPFLKNVIFPFLKGVGKSVFSTFKVAIGVIGVVAKVLGWIGEKAAPLKGVFEGLGQVVGFVFGGSLIKVFGWAMKLIPGFGLVGGAVSKFGGAVQKVIDALRRGIGWVWDKLGGLAQFLTGLAGGIATAAATMWDGFKTALGVVIDWAEGKLKGLVKLAEGLPEKVKNAISGAPSGIWNKITSQFRPKTFADMNATGGVITRPGLSWVGERGPELMNVPSAATIIPAAQSRALTRGDVDSVAAPAATTRGGGETIIRTPIFLTIAGRVIAEVYDEYRLQQAATA